MGTWKRKKDFSERELTPDKIYDKRVTNIDVAMKKGMFYMEDTR